MSLFDDIADPRSRAARARQDQRANGTLPEQQLPPDWVETTTSRADGWVRLVAEQGLGFGGVNGLWALFFVGLLLLLAAAIGSTGEPDFGSPAAGMLLPALLGAGCITYAVVQSLEARERRNIQVLIPGQPVHGGAPVALRIGIPLTMQVAQLHSAELRLVEEPSMVTDTGRRFLPTRLACIPLGLSPAGTDATHRWWEGEFCLPADAALSFEEAEYRLRWMVSVVLPRVDQPPLPLDFLLWVTRNTE